MSRSAIIVDDEVTSVETLHGLIERYCPEIDVIACADGVHTSLEEIKKSKPELIFLDVEMRDGTGFDLLEQIEEPYSGKVIFVTAYDNYAVKAFRYCALDYLLKPVDPDLLMQAVEKALRTPAPGFADKLRILSDNSKGKEKIVLPSRDEIYVTDVNDIVRCEANGNYTIFHINNQKPKLISKSLKEFDDLLCGNKFLRTHKSHLINLDYVEKYLPRESLVIMKDGGKAEVSRRKKDLFMQFINSK